MASFKAKSGQIWCVFPRGKKCCLLTHLPGDAGHQPAPTLGLAPLPPQAGLLIVCVADAAEFSPSIFSDVRFTIQSPTAHKTCPWKEENTLLGPGKRSDEHCCVGCGGGHRHRKSSSTRHRYTNTQKDHSTLIDTILIFFRFFVSGTSEASVPQR